MVKLRRWFNHAFLPPWYWRKSFSAEALSAIERAIRQSEAQHHGELRFAIENSLPPGYVWHGMSARYRANLVFSNLRVWDTERNSGVLIYVQLADREVHIVADRGINKVVAQSEWERIAHDMAQEFRKGHFKEGSVNGIETITKLLASHFPADADNPNELSDKPVIIKR